MRLAGVEPARPRAGTALSTPLVYLFRHNRLRMAIRTQIPEVRSSIVEPVAIDMVHLQYQRSSPPFRVASASFTDLRPTDFSESPPEQRRLLTPVAGAPDQDVSCGQPLSIHATTSMGLTHEMICANPVVRDATLDGRLLTAAPSHTQVTQHASQAIAGGHGLAQHVLGVLHRGLGSRARSKFCKSTNSITAAMG